MSLVAYGNGTSGNLLYSNGGQEGVSFLATTTTLTVNSADAGALSGAVYLFSDTNNNVKFQSWPARYSVPNGRAISILLRQKASYTGSPSARRCLLPSLSTCGSRGPAIELTHETTGSVAFSARNELLAAVNTTTTVAAWSPTSGTWYDVVLVWDGTAGANSLTVYVDAVSLGSITPGAAMSSSWTNQWFQDLCLGATPINSGVIRGSTDEFAIWDSVINPTSVALQSGTGSLNGASRSSLLAFTSMAGIHNGYSRSRVVNR